MRKDTFTDHVMNRLDTLLCGGVPLIAVGFADKTSAQVIQSAKQEGLDVAELRVDLYESYQHQYVLDVIRQFKHLPSIATIRIGKEGGKWGLSEQQRLALFKAIVTEVDSVDIELQAEEILSDVVKVTHEAGKLVFISYHNFDETPTLSALNLVAKRAIEVGADAIKIATHAKSMADIRTLAQFTIEKASLNIVTMAMGAKGVVSRLFFPSLGSRLTFAYIGQPSAPGQLRFDETFDILRKLYPDFNQKKISALELMEAA